MNSIPVRYGSESSYYPNKVDGISIKGAKINADPSDLDPDPGQVFSLNYT